MRNDSVRISCLLEGSSAIDFDRLAVTFKPGDLGFTKAKTQAWLLGAALLLLDQKTSEFVIRTGRRYPKLDELLIEAGCRPEDVKAVLGGSSVTFAEKLAEMRGIDGVDGQKAKSTNPPGDGAASP